MTEKAERRNSNTKRVAVETLVEVCGGARGFEAESVNISGTGMHVRTAYLPEEGAPLVCRFHDKGREVVAEGEVVWRREGTRGGEFGVRFTALDSRGVAALRELCGELPSEDAEHSLESEDDDEKPPLGHVGARVRLHIAGLGAPMKARVSDSTRRRVRVASKLEFLKVGRELELEDLEQGERRTACIDGVDVSLDPGTRIPQLVVALRLSDGDTTPDPSVVDTGRSRARASAELPKPSERSRVAGRASTDGPDWSDERDAASETAPEDDDENAVQAVRGRLASFAQSAGAATERAGKNFAAAGAVAVRELGGLLRNARSRVRSRDPRGEASKRKTAPAPQGPLKVDGRKVVAQSPSLRPQSPSRAPLASDTRSASSPPRGTKRRMTRAMIGAGGLAVCAALGFSFFGRANEPPGELQAESSAPPSVNVTAAPGAAPEVTKTTPEEGTPSPAATAVVANVPLFGATPMATMEPVPLGAPPVLSDRAAADEARERALAASTRVEDELWPKDKGDESDPNKESAAKDPEASSPEPDAPKSPNDVTPWGRGRMNLPTIHRLRLDAPGDAIIGTVKANGFSVVVPRRKVLEDGKGIKTRDKRISKLRSRNIGGGAEVALEFSSKVPAYRVRLRKDFLELLISAPEDKK